VLFPVPLSRYGAVQPLASGKSSCSSTSQQKPVQHVVEGAGALGLEFYAPCSNLVESARRTGCCCIDNKSSSLWHQSCITIIIYHSIRDVVLHLTVMAHAKRKL
jgi:hypothetical protein